MVNGMTWMPVATVSQEMCQCGSERATPHLLSTAHHHKTSQLLGFTIKILKIGTPGIITIIVLQLEQLEFTVQYCVQKMQTE